MTHKKTKSNNLISASLMGALIGSTALSPIMVSKAEAALDEMVVTATRREAFVQDIPYNISAISGDMIEQANVFDNVELLRLIPGISMVDRGARNSGTVNTIRIRGLNADSAAIGDYAVSGGPAVSTYVDDTPLYANFMIRDLERVEVLRGPQGTLYGSGSLGGTLRYITHAPELGEFSGKVGASLSQVKGSDDIGNIEDLTLNIPLGETMALRVTGSRVDLPGLTDYVNVYELDANGIPVAPSGVLSPDASYRSVKDADTVEQWFVRGKLLWEPTDTIDLTLTYAQQSDEIGGRRGPSLGVDGFGRPYGDDEQGSIQLEPSSRDVYMTSLEANVDLGFATLTSSTSYYDHEGDSVSENTGFYAQLGWLGFYYNYPRPMASAVRTYSDEAFTQEFRLVSNLEGPIDYTLGLYYQDKDREATQQSFLRGSKAWWDAAYPGLTFLVSGDQDWDFLSKESYEEFAVFGELTYHITDTVQVTGGFRYFDNEATTNTHMSLPWWVGLFPDSDESYKVSENDTIFKGNISWDFTEEDMVYATISQGYRRGGTNGVPTTGFFAEDPAWQVYDSDTLTNYEIGIKGARSDFSYSAALFLMKWDDTQLNTSTTNWGFFAVQNGDSTASQGFEVELQGSLMEGLNYNFGYTYVKSELTDDLITPTGTLIATDGTQLPATPEHTISAGANYTHSLSSGVDLTYRLDGYYQSETRNIISTGHSLTQDLDGFSLWNASVSAGFEDFDVTLWVKNITNEDGVTGVFTEGYMGTAPGEGYFGNGSKELISLPRTFGISANYRF